MCENVAAEGVLGVRASLHLGMGTPMVVRVVLAALLHPTRNWPTC